MKPVAFLSILSLFVISAPQVCADGPESEPKARKLEAAALARLIDEHIDKRLKLEKVPSSPRTEDAEFLRRAYLDIHGVIPTVEQARTFLAGDAPDRRARLIDDLLASPRYAAHFADLWHNHLYPPSANNRIKPEALVRYLEQGFQTKTWDRLAHDLVTRRERRTRTARSRTC